MDDLIKKKEAYLLKILKKACKIKEYDILVIELPETSKDAYGILLSLEKKLNIKIYFNIVDYKNAYHLFKSSSSIEDRKAFFSRIDLPNNLDNIKYLFLMPYTANRYLRLMQEEKLYKDYCSISQSVQSDFNTKASEIISSGRVTLASVPDEMWSINTGFSNDELWNLLFRTIPSNKVLHEEIQRLKEIRKYLNSLKIKTLYIQSETGTDLKIGLNELSRWSTIYDEKILCNFPSYEVYTSPDKYKVDGTMISTLSSSLMGFHLSEGIFKFKKGKLVSCKTNDELLNKVLLYSNKGLNYCGEIGLVSMDNPLSRLNTQTENILLDENIRAHLALGNSLDESIRLKDTDKKEDYNFNDSDYHFDIPFGDRGLFVQAKSNGKRLTLIDNGVWII